MPKFKKKPLEVEAVQFTGDNFKELQAFCGKHKDAVEDWWIDTIQPIGTNLLTIDKDITAEVWDKTHSCWVGAKDMQWIIKGTQGEFYPCDVDVFNESYDPVVEEPEVEDYSNDYNEYCMRCSKHLGIPYHETDEHDDAAERLRRMKK